MLKLKRKTESREICAYEVFPVNFVMLPKQKRDETLGRFQRLLNSLPCETRLSAVKTAKTLEIGENKLTTTYYRFFVESMGEPVDWLLEQCGFKQQPLTELPKPEPVKTFPKYMALQSGKLMKSFAVYQLPGMLLPGFVSELYGLCDRILICIKPLPPEMATTRMGKYMRFLRSLILADQTKGRIVRDEIKLKHAMAEATYQSLITGSTRLFELKVTASITGETLDELKTTTKKLKDTLQSRFIRLDSPAYLQHELALGAVGKKSSTRARQAHFSPSSQQTSLSPQAEYFSA